jgi:hypothetical protein
VRGEHPAAATISTTPLAASMRGKRSIGRPANWARRHRGCQAPGGVARMGLRSGGVVVDMNHPCRVEVPGWRPDHPLSSGACAAPRLGERDDRGTSPYGRRERLRATGLATCLEFRIETARDGENICLDGRSSIVEKNGAGTTLSDNGISR